MSAQATSLPHWETTPEDLKAATREIKAAIRGAITEWENKYTPGL